MFRITIGRAGADENFILARLHTHRIGLGIPELERLLVDFDYSRSRLPCLYIDTLETPKRLQGTIRVLQVADIELHDF